MKRKVFTLIVVLMLVMSAFLTACNPNRPSEPGQDGSDADSSSNQETANLENADILALSYDRMENADLSFNFTMDVSAQNNSGSTYSVAKSYNAQASESDENNGLESVTYAELTASDCYGKYVDVGPYDFFEDQQSMLNRFRDEARNMTDFAIDHITVMDTVVQLGAYKYMLSYDDASDIVTLYYSCDYGDEIEFYQLTIYFDEDGEESVSMRRAYGNYSVENIIYTPNKYYSIQRRYWDAVREAWSYHINMAYKDVDGYWRGLQTFFNLENPYLSHEGTYDYANGTMGIGFLFETDSGFCSFEDKLLAYRDGSETGSGVDASPTDEIRIVPSWVSCDEMYVDLTNNLFTVFLSLLNGWEKVRFPSNNRYGYRTEGNDSYLELKNGTKLLGNSIWHEDKGWLIPNWKYDCDLLGNYYYRNDGYQNGDMADWNYDESVTFYAEANKYPNENGGVTMDSERAYFNVVNISSEESLLRIKSCFDANGLSIIGHEHLFEDIVEIQSQKDMYTDRVFEKIFGTTYTVENFTKVLFDYAPKFESWAEEICSPLNTDKVIDFENLPAKPSNIGLIKLGKGIGGKAIIAASGIDFSQFNATVNKSVILSEGKEYGIFVGWGNGNGVAQCAAFDNQKYALEAMTFVGKNNIPLPQTNIEGEYQLKAFFGKYEEEKWICLSETLPVSVVDFQAFTIDYTVDGGYYRHEFSSKNGTAFVNVTFVDIEAPVLYYNGDVVTEQITLKFFETMDAAGLAALFVAQDNADGDIVITYKNIVKNGEKLSEDSVIDDGVYILTVADVAGNESVSQITVNVQE